MSSESEREGGHETKPSGSGNHAPEALIWYNTNVKEKDKPEKALGYMRLIRTGDEEHWSDPYSVLSQEILKMFAFRQPGRIVENEYFLLAMECLRTALTDRDQTTGGPGGSSGEDVLNNTTEVYDMAWADTFIEESEVMKNSATLRDLPADMKTSLIQTPIIQPIAQFASALWRGLEGSEGRHGVACLMNVLKYVIESSFPELTGSYIVESAGSECTPNDACLCVAYIKGAASKEQLEDEELKCELLKREMKVENKQGQHTIVPDVSFLYTPPSGTPGPQEVVLTVDIQSTAATVRPPNSAWVQGLAGLKQGTSTYCITLTQEKAVLHSLELWDSNVLFANRVYYTIRLPEKGETPSFYETIFLQLVHDCLKVIFSHFRSHHEQF